MFKNLSYTQKNKLLLPLAGVGLLICWFFAFGKTYQAVKLNYELAIEQQVVTDLSFNPEHTQRKLSALTVILKAYHVKEGDWSNDLWMKSSALAMKQQVGIDYTITKPLAEKDTTSLGINQTLYCYGNYVQLVKLLDTLERTNGIGRISGLQIKAPKDDANGERAAQCTMKLEFKGLTESDK